MKKGNHPETKQEYSKLFGYLKHNPKHRIKKDLSYPNFGDWSGQYPEAEEEILQDTKAYPIQERKL